MISLSKYGQTLRVEVPKYFRDHFFSLLGIIKVDQQYDGSQAIAGVSDNVFHYLYCFYYFL